MGFYIKDLYVSSVHWHDPLTNPPTVPETSPVLVAAKYHTAAVRAVEAGAQVRGGEAATLLPPDDGGGWVWPTRWTITHTTTSPYLNPGEVIQEGDYLQILTVLRQSVETVERVMESLKPDQKQLDHVAKTLQSAGE